MVRFHVLHYKIIGHPAVKCVPDVFEPQASEVSVDRIHDRDLLVSDHVRVISHSRRNIILTFEKIDLVVIDANVDDIV